MANGRPESLRAPRRSTQTWLTGSSRRRLMRTSLLAGVSCADGAGVFIRRNRPGRRSSGLHRPGDEDGTFIGSRNFTP